MHGEGNNWGGFSQRQVLRMLDEFAIRKQLDTPARTEIIDWLRSLPWDDWQDDLVLHNTADDEDEDPILDHDPERHGGLIKLVDRGTRPHPAKTASTTRQKGPLKSKLVR